MATEGDRIDIMFLGPPPGRWIRYWNQFEINYALKKYLVMRVKVEFET